MASRCLPDPPARVTLAHRRTCGGDHVGRPWPRSVSCGEELYLLCPLQAPAPMAGWGGWGRGMTATLLTHGREVSDLPSAARLSTPEPWLRPPALRRWHVARQHSPGCHRSSRRHAGSQSWALAAALASPRAQWRRRLSGPSPALLPWTPRADRVPSASCARYYLVLTERCLLTEGREGWGGPVRAHCPQGGILEIRARRRSQHGCDARPKSWLLWLAFQRQPGRDRATRDGTESSGASQAHGPLREAPQGRDTASLNPHQPPLVPHHPPAGTIPAGGLCQAACRHPPAHPPEGWGQLSACSLGQRTSAVRPAAAVALKAHPVA